jgi:CSLREA domain-containing protein
MPPDDIHGRYLESIIMSKSGIVQALSLCACFFLSQPIAAATFVVDSSLDTPDTNPGNGTCEATSGGTQCTLRAAIQEANALAGFDEITFSLGLVVINISGSALPAISETLRIDGSTAPSYNAAASDTRSAPPSVYIDGDALAGASRGLNINTSEHVEIIALGITGFPGDGIGATGNQSCLIDSNWIGVSRGGGAKANGTDGIYLQDTSNCVIGREIVGTAIHGRGNVISDNTDDGVHIFSGSGNILGGNYIGLDPIGSTDHGNGGHGINTAGTAHQIGQIRTAAPALATGNLIGNNGGDGVHVGGQESTLLANYIFENDGNGMWLSGDDTVAGNSYDHARNIVDTNGKNGILVTDGSSIARVEVRNNWAFGNAEHGIRVENGNEIDLVENAIWDNLDDAIYLDANNSDAWGNQLGTAANGSGNAGSGIVIDGNNNTLSGNEIGGVTANGIDMVAGTGNQLHNNWVGTDDTFTDLGNGGNGIRLQTLVQQTLLQGNRIGHNGGSGVFNEGADGTEITSNQIGSGLAGQAMANGGSGIHIDANSLNARVSNNVIGHNLLDGILLDGGGARVCGNWIGVGQGLQDAGNAVEGIRLRGTLNSVGNPSLICGGNHIGFNNSDGIQLEGLENTVRDNFLGGKVIGGVSTNFGNGAGGILLTANAGENVIQGNVMRHNGDHGVRVSTTAGIWNAIRMNDFRFNGGMAIDLKLDGPTPNDAGDYDDGPNDLQNTPVFDSVQAVGPELKITYRVDSVVGAAEYPITVDFYVSQDNEREGRWVAISYYTVAPNTQWQKQFNPGVTSGYVMAMATDAKGNSSEFSAPTAFAVELADLIFSNGFEN